MVSAHKPTRNVSRCKADDPEQSKRFIDTAKEVGADEDAEALERAFKKISSNREPPRDNEC